MFNIGNKGVALQNGLYFLSLPSATQFSRAKRLTGTFAAGSRFFGDFTVLLRPANRKEPAVQRLRADRPAVLACGSGQPESLVERQRDPESLVHGHRDRGRLRRMSGWRAAGEGRL